MSKGIQVWNKILTSAMQLPGVKVDRNAFLSEKLSIYCNESQIAQSLEKGPIGIISSEILDLIAKDCIKHHTIYVTAISTAMGVPGGIALLGTVPGDVTQYFYHVFVLAQKLAYIYGYPDLCDESGNFSESAADLLTVFVGVMGGVSVANKVIQELAEQCQKEVLKRLPKYFLTKTLWYPIIKQVVKWITGKQLTKGGFAKTVSKFVPIVGGLVSGGLTYATFKPQSKRLMYKLKSTMLLAYENKKNEHFDQGEKVKDC